MENEKNPSIEEDLKDGIEEVKNLFEAGAPLLAGFQLYLLEKTYTRQGLQVPDEVLNMQKSIEFEITTTYPTKINIAIETGNYHDAVGLFVSFAVHYSRMHKKIPFEFWNLREKIVIGSEDEFFKHTYPRYRFEEA